MAILFSNESEILRKMRLIEWLKAELITHVGYLYQFPEIITNSGTVGTFELDIFKLDISSMDRLDHELINNDSLYYTNQLLKN